MWVCRVCQRTFIPVEIIGTPGNYRVYEPTQIFVDSGYDCNIAAVNRVVTGRKKELLAGYAVKIAELIRLRGDHGY